LRRGLLLLLLTGLIPVTQAAAPSGAHHVRDLYYGQALYQYYQQQELAAITQLMVAAERPRHPTSQIAESNLLLADLYYNYGLYEESSSLFTQLLDAQVSAALQNSIRFNLGRQRYDQGQYDQARDLLSRIDDQLPRNIEAERKYLLSNLYLNQRQYDEAANLSEQIDSQSIWKAYARYNLGVTLIEDTNVQRGETILDSLGQMQPGDSEQLALRDLANLSLGLKQLRLGQVEPALQSLSRVRLEGPFSNQALLASGWGWYALDQYDKAVVPWSVLVKRNEPDAATQEAILAIPASYANSGRDKLAVRYYELAAKQFELQLESLQNAIQSIDQGELIASLRDSAILDDRNSLQRLPPISPVTSQLYLLLASTEFHQQVKRYHDLLDIRQALGNWGDSFPTLELMLDERQRAFAEKLPRLQQSSNLEQFERLSQRRDEFATKIEAIEAEEDYLALVTPEEEDQLQRLQRVALSIVKVASETNMDYQQDMFRVLSGLMHYEMAIDFPVRFWKAKKQLIQLDRALLQTKTRVASLGRITERTESDIAEFQGRISGQTGRIAALRQRVDGLLQQQEQLINKLGIDALDAQQQHVKQLRLNARFELARIYDKLAAPQ
jgi:tetratricopeptide (TPR) repeat protein